MTAGVAMNAHALGILELPRLLDLVAERAASAPGAARVLSLQPSSDLAWLEAEHRRVGAVRSRRSRISLGSRRSIVA